MTKFEEEAIKEFDSSEYVYTAYDGTFRGETDGTVMEFAKGTTIYTFPWLEFAKNWHSDEEFQELLDKYSNLNDNYEKEVIRSSKLEFQLISREKQVIELREADKAQGKEIIQLKSQLQQQSLPVVPECVAELFNEYRFENIQRLFEFGIDDIKSNKMIKALMWRDKHPDTFSLAFITRKYEVEKPQLFYLKHIDMSKQSRYCDCYLVKEDDGTLWHDDTINKNEKPGGGYKNSCYKFTQKEIDSMQTGSYEQIKVEEEK